LLGGLIEAAILVVITQGAFTIAEGGNRTLEILGRTVSIGALVATGLGLVVLRMAFGMASSRQAAHLGAAAVARTRSELADAYFAADWQTTHRDRSGRLQELLTNFASRSGELMFQVGRIVFASFALAALLAVAIVVDAAASVAAIAVVGLLILVLRPLRRAVRRRAEELATDDMELATALAEIDALDLEARVFGVRSTIRARLGGLVDRVAMRHRRLRFRQELALPASSSLLYAAMFVALAVVSATSGTNLTSVGAVMLILLRAFGYAQLLQTATVGLNTTLPFLDELQTELTRLEAARVEDGGVPVGTVETIALENVSFEYEPGAPVLREISASIGPREVVGVVGPSGAGKSTLALLVLGVLSPTSGAVLADGRDVADLSDADWRQAVGFVPQQPHLIAGSVADNIRFFREGVSEGDVERAARLAHLHDEIVSRAGGYDGAVGERGGALSGGQQQRLTIARALVAEPDVLVLDEPTSALDPRNEQLIRTTLEGLRETMTIVVVAHRRTTLDICDRIMVIRDGRLEAFGAPGELRRDSVHFREILELSGLE
jgi:ABC-type multidrug transport system fused ATPase/permease subunit